MSKCIHLGSWVVSACCKLAVLLLPRPCLIIRDVWKAYAALQGGRGSYLRFANMLINDSIYLLDESLKYVKVGLGSAGLTALCVTWRLCSIFMGMASSRILGGSKEGGDQCRGAASFNLRIKRQQKHMRALTGGRLHT